MGPLVRTIFGLAFGAIVSRLLGVVGRFRTSRLATRRTFVRNAALGATGVVGTITAAGFGALLWPNKTGAFGSTIAVPADDVPPVGGVPLNRPAGRFLLVHNEDGLLALYTKCPHLGCTVPYVGPPDSPSAFACPCHGSLYDYNGVRTGGPAPRPMDLMEVTVEGDNVLVDTGKISQRAGYSPDQARPFQA
jgi:cytochrome b6-f complex iron-sulfur subunit